MHTTPTWSKSKDAQCLLMWRGLFAMLPTGRHHIKSIKIISAVAMQPVLIYFKQSFLR